MKLRNFLKVLLTSMLAIFMCFALVGCGEKAGGGNLGNTDDPSDGGTTVTGPHKIYLIGKPDGTFNIWAWKSPSNKNYDSKSWPGGTFQFTQSDDIGYYCMMELDTSSDLGILFVKSDESEKTADIVVPKDVIQKNATLYFVYEETNYYTDLNDILGSDQGYTVDESLAPPAEGYIRINTLSTDANNLWIWSDFDQDAMKKCVSWDDANGGFPIKGTNGSFVYADVKLAENPKLLNFIVRKGTNKLSGENDLSFIFPSKYNEIFVKRNGKIYVDKDLTQLPKGLVSAKIKDTNVLQAEFQGITLTTDNLKIYKSDKTTEVEIQTISNDKITLKTHNCKTDGAVFVVYTDELGTDERMANIDSSLVDTWFEVKNISDFGYHDGVFKTWAPLATSAKVLLYSDVTAVKNNTIAKEIPMTRNFDDGTWSTENVSSDVGNNKYYKFALVNNGITYNVSDIWSYVASPDSEASQIIDINDPSITSNWEATYTNPFGNSGSEIKKYSEAIIYEMHIRDWAKAFGSTNKGKFTEITAELGDTGKFATHLKDLGITHVQILPAFDYAQPNSDEKYNWGYNPYHYNVPEGRYVKDMVDGTDAVKQFRDLIKAFHDQGIAVIMDVVYNHTAGTGNGSLYDMTIPQYFYRMTANGSYSNGSGCGNEVATNHKMVAKYVIDSLVHWMKDYHINGFRFDLMGCQEQDFMTEVYETLYEIDPNVMVYGEPWTGGDSTVKKGTDNTISTTVGFGVGAFEDTFRNAIKGAEYPDWTVGQVQGSFDDKAITDGLLGKSGRNSDNGESKPGLMLSYVECHDNFTLFDKLAISYLSKKEFSGDLFATIKEAGLIEVKKQNILSAAYVFLSQGTPFINGGQEFLRTKQGDHNSYQSDDSINAIDFSFKTTYADVYNSYKGLIAFRKANSKVFGNNTSANAEKVVAGVTKYTAGDYLIYFNATSSAETISTTGYSKVIDVTSGTPTESTTLPTSVPAKSFVILAK